MTDTAAQATGSWQATAIGMLLVVVLLIWTIVPPVRAMRQGVRRRHRPRTSTPTRRSFAVPSWLTDPAGAMARLPKWPGRRAEIPQALLDAEAAAVRGLLDGRIDPAAYRARMHDLASRTQAVSKHRP